MQPIMFTSNGTIQGIQNVPVNTCPVSSDDLTWLIQCYGHLIPAGQQITPQKFAELISNQYQVGKPGDVFADSGKKRNTQAVLMCQLLEMWNDVHCGAQDLARSL